MDNKQLEERIEYLSNRVNELQALICDWKGEGLSKKVATLEKLPTISKEITLTKEEV